MIKETENTVIMEPDSNVTASIIWLHGLGANGHDFVPVVEELGIVSRGIRVLLPHAPEMPVSINNGYIMPAWYDIRDNDLTHEQDAEGIEQSSNRIQTIIEEQITSGLTAENIVLAGFSQGGAVVLHCGFRLPFAIAGIMSLSSYLPLADNFSKEISTASKNTPVFIGHGSHDPVVPPAAAEMTQQALNAQGISVETHTYPMEHSVSIEEITDIGLWLEKVLD